MRIIFYAIAMLFLLSQQGKAQTISAKEKEAIQVLIDTADYYNLRDPNRCLQLVDSILRRVPEKGNERIHVAAYISRTNSYKMLSKKTEAIQAANKAIQLAINSKDPFLQVRAYFIKASIFGEYDDQDSALVYYQRVIDLHQPGFETYYVSSAYTNVGLVYAAIGNLTKAEEYILKGYRLTSGDDYAKTFALAGVISFYAEFHNPKYLPYLDTLAMSDFYRKATPESFMAHFDSFLLLDEATDEEKEKKFREVYEYSLQHSSLVNQVGYGLRLKTHLMAMRKYEDAHQLLLSLYQKAIQSKNGQRINSVLLALFQSSKARGKLDEALHYIELQNKLQDSLLSNENRNLISELNIKFETAQKDHEIEQQQVRLTEQRRSRNFFIVLFLLVTALAVLVYVYFKNRAKAAQRIAREEKARMEKEKEIGELKATLDTQESERNRIARDLHDGIGSMMSGISSQIEYLKSQNSFNGESHEHLSQLRELVKEATAELRRTSYELMPAKLLRQGLEPAIRDLCMNLLVKNGIEPVLEINADLTTLSPEQQLTTYRIVQELLNNIVKHAGAKNVLIQFTRVDDELSVVVEDDGKGFDVQAGKMQSGLGLSSLQSRANLLKGVLDIASTPGEGTTVTLNFNLELSNQRSHS